jgi:hypothetical protein
MKTSFLRFILPLATLAFVAPAAALAQKNNNAATPTGPTVIPAGVVSTTYVIDKPGSYMLGGNRTMSDASKPAIEITANDVTLDLGGHILAYSGTGNYKVGAIHIPVAVNVEVRNGAIVDTPSVGIASVDTAGVGLRLIDLRLSNTGGISSGAQHTHIERCHVVDTKVYSAIHLWGQGGAVLNCHVRNAPTGIYVYGGSRVVGNTVINITSTAIRVQGQNGVEGGGLVLENTVQRANTSAFAFNGGIYVSAANVMIRGNSVSAAKGFGISAEGEGLVVEGNQVGHTQAGATANGPGIAAKPSSVLRNNSGYNNAGGLISGTYLNGGGNLGN